MNPTKYFFIILFITCHLFSQSIEDGFRFYLPPDDTSRQAFLPYFKNTNIQNSKFIDIDVDGHFNYNAQTIRFFGTNLVADGAFPVKEKAWFIAGRLRKMGFNLVRFHHIDNPWSDATLFNQTGSTRILNSETLDRLEYLINELKKNGIFVNMNLHVSRTFRIADGVADADSIPDYGKGVTYFDPHLIQLQKEYASQLLQHVNPYSGQTLANDPVMAMVEIINENSLYRMWRDNNLKHFSQGGKLTRRHTNMLDSLWHDFLEQKYENTANIAQAWNADSRPGGENEQIPDNGFEEGKLLQNWFLEKHESANGTMSLEENTANSGSRSAKIDITNGDGVDWHIQWKKTGLTIKKDSLYSITFAVKTNTPRTISAVVMKDSDPWTTYKSYSFYATTQWQEFSFTIKAPVEIEKGIRLSFHLGATTSTYWFDDVGFHSSPVLGLEDHESLETGNIARLDFGQCNKYSDNRIRDISTFYLKVQDDFLAEMYNYLKNDLGVVVPIVGTNWNVGPADMTSQAKMDYIDNHIYWDHPAFPKEPWSPTDWTINNTAMVNEQNGGTIASIMSGTAVAGKPYTVSEYNHAFPNRYQSEGMLFITAYSSFHDVDGIMFFDYGGSVSDWETDKIEGYFGQNRNPAMMSLAPSCAMAYRNHYISKANEFLKINYSNDDMLLLPKIDPGGWQSPQLYPTTLALQHGIRNESFSADDPFNPDLLPPAPSQPYTTDTGEIIWNTSGLMTTSAEKFFGLTGFLSQHRGKIIGPHRLLDGSQFATFTWISLDDNDLQSAKYSLMTLSYRAGNMGMIWDGTSTVHNNWGSSPVLMDRAFITMQLAIEADSIRIYPLSELGSVTNYNETFYPSNDGKFIVKLDQDLDGTTWFGVETFGNPLTLPNETQPDGPESFELYQNFPNPFNPTTNIRYSIKERSDVKINVYNNLGQVIKELILGEKTPGRYEIQLDMSEFSSGLYYYQLSTNNFVQTRKLLLMK
jgi:hypothetical protein